MSIIAFDVDYKRIHAWSDKIGRVCFDAPEWRPFADTIVCHDTILMEVFSPIFYDKSTGNPSKDKAIRTNKMKMALFNARICGEMYSWLIDRYGYAKAQTMLVAPSSLWSLGHEEDIRHEIAGVTGQDNHDIRECRAMIFFYQRNPRQWYKVTDYYNDYPSKGHP